jgi:ribonuclease HI
VRQTHGTYQVRSETLRPLYEQAQQLAEEFESFTLTHIGRQFNRTADQLANAAIDERSDD